MTPEPTRLCLVCSTPTNGYDQDALFYLAATNPAEGWEGPANMAGRVLVAHLLCLERFAKAEEAEEG